MAFFLTNSFRKIQNCSNYLIMREFKSIGSWLIKQLWRANNHCKTLYDIALDGRFISIFVSANDEVYSCIISLDSDFHNFSLLKEEIVIAVFFFFY